MKKNPPPEATDLIKRMASTGFSKRGIALNMGVSVDLLNRWLEDHEELGDAFAWGREEEHNALFNALYSQAIHKGNATAAMFLLKARHGYREGDQSEIANRVSITFNLPGADKLETVVSNAKNKVIDHG